MNSIQYHNIPKRVEPGRRDVTEDGLLSLLENRHLVTANKQKFIIFTNKKGGFYRSQNLNINDFKIMPLQTSNKGSKHNIKNRNKIQVIYQLST